MKKINRCDGETKKKEQCKKPARHARHGLHYCTTHYIQRLESIANRRLNRKWKVQKN